MYAAQAYRKVGDSAWFSKFMEDIKDTLGCRYYEYMESIMGVYMEVDDYRNAILIFSDEPELRMLIEAYEAINYDDDGIIDNLNGMLNLNVLQLKFGIIHATSGQLSLMCTLKMAT